MNTDRILFYPALYLYEIVIKGNGCTSKGDNPVKFALLPSEMEFTVKGKNLPPRGANLFLLELLPFQKRIAVSKANRKPSKLSSLFSQNDGSPGSILYNSIAGRNRPVSYPDVPITARYRFIKNAY